MTLITGAIKLIDQPDQVTFTTVTRLLQDLTRYLAIEFDAEKLTNIVISHVEPDVANRSVIWVRLNNAGNVSGLNVYAQGTWLQIFPPPQALFRMYGRSDAVPPGFYLVSEDTPGFTEDMVTALQAQWHEIDGETGVYDIFDVVYRGL